jgi:hypothetical protein
MSGRYSVSSDSFHRQNVQRFAELSCKRGTRGFLATAHRNPAVIKFKSAKSGSVAQKQMRA